MDWFTTYFASSSLLNVEDFSFLPYVHVSLLFIHSFELLITARKLTLSVSSCGFNISGFSGNSRFWVFITKSLFQLYFHENAFCRKFEYFH